MNIKILLISFFLTVSCFCISIQEAINKVNELKITKIGETINLPTPLKQINYGNKKYWVIEIDYGKDISLLVVIDNKGKIVYSNYAKDIMKIYYLDHYFYKNNQLKDFFDDLKKNLINVKTDLEDRINAYNTIKKLSNLQLDDSKCIYYIKKTKSKINEIFEDIDKIDYDLNSVSEIKKLNYSINQVFLDIKNYIISFKETINRCDDYRTTLIKQYKNDTKYQNIIIQLNNILNLDSYLSRINALNLSLNENKKIINKMFEKLNFYVDQYYQMFLERIENSKKGKERQEKLEKLKNLEILFENISKHSSFLSKYEIKKIKELWEQYNKTYYDVLNYNFENFDEKYKKIKEELEKYVNKINKKIKEFYKTNEQKTNKNNNSNTNIIIIVLILITILFILVYFNKKKKKKKTNFENIDFDPFNKDFFD